MRPALTPALLIALATGLPGCVEGEPTKPGETGCSPASWYADVDGDGWGDDSVSVEACGDEVPEGYVEQPGDCDDIDANRNPEAVEDCDGLDDDCDGTIDEEAVDQLTWWADADGDSWGDPKSTRMACEQPPGHVLNDGDCDDTDPETNPDTPEECNGLDDDCDGVVDDPEELDTTTYWPDGDGDGYGDESMPTELCEARPGYVLDDQDCDDGDASIHPEAMETCDGVDENCNGIIDDPKLIEIIPWYPDGDGDGYGTEAGAVEDCAPPGSGYVTEGGDCDDADASIHPDAKDVCEDGVDQDCDGSDACTLQTGLLISEWSSSNIHAWDPLTDSLSLYHSSLSNDADCNQDQGRVEGWIVEHFDDHVLSFVPGAGTGESIVVNTAYAYPKHVAVVDGDVLVMSRNDGIIKRYDGTGLEIDSVSTGYSTGQGIATDGSSVFVSVWDGADSRILEFDLDLSYLGEISKPTGMTLGNLVDLAYDARTGRWYGLDASGEGGTGTNTTRIIEFDMGGSVLSTWDMPVAMDGLGVLACP